MNNITGTKYLNLLTDFGFKAIFASEKNKDLLIDFLNELRTKLLILPTVPPNN